MLDRGSVGNMSRAGLSTSPGAEVCGKLPAFKIGGKRVVDCCA